MATILVLDDRQPERQYLATLLRYAGYRVIETADAPIALSAVRADCPDLVITDILMPTMDGFEFVRQMRQQPEAKDVPVIFYTANYENEARDLVTQCGGARILFKPAEPELVLRTVEDQLGAPPNPIPRPSEVFDRAHLELVTTKLHQKMTDLERTNLDRAHLELVTTKLHQKTTDLERTNLELAEREKELRLVTNAVPVLIAFIDREERYQLVNSAHQDWTGLCPEEIRGKAMAEVLGQETYSKLRPYVRRALAGENVTYDELLRYGNGAERHVRATYVPNLDPEGNVRGFVSLIEDLTTLKRAEIGLRQANETLQRSNEALREFAYAAAHDLREPSRQVALFAELIATRYRGKVDAGLEELLKYCHTGAHRMADLVSDLLTLAELTESLALHKDVPMNDANEVLKHTLQDLCARIAESGARITCGSVPQVRMHSSHLYQLFLNLIGNAIKFRNPSRPLEIAVTGQHRGTEAVFSIEDNGMGIAPGYFARIFELFRRLHGQDYEGTGIGLALCRRIVESYGGRIWVESEVEIGSTFYFTVPDHR
jgi:PAS domain S-box-containing protein